MTLFTRVALALASVMTLLMFGPGGQNWSAQAGIEYGHASARALIGCQAVKEWPASAWASCAGGPGVVRVYAECWHENGNYRVPLTGPWVFAGNRSYAICQGPQVFLVYATYQT